MKIIVLNGSPKGLKSVTMQYVHYIQKKYPQHELKIVNISQQINKLEKDDLFYQAIMKEIGDSDGILWATPVYFLLVPANYKRFIELIFEKGKEAVFSQKYTAVLTTSIHFFDHTAHNYMHAICDDLNMNHLGSYSADMCDLIKAEERTRLEAFAANLFHEIESKAVTAKRFSPLKWRDFQYHPGDLSEETDLTERVSLGEKNLLIDRFSGIMRHRYQENRSG